ncbi:DsrE family protein [Neolewinella aurantiaca]|uniref:DsrE family protein n=1 Tax=Neolewinella aurantiaca TaxID=2602767 RepID=A0A5C7FVP3_9BACT|nr:DsrE family protein [Neolewinella aurantiaca]TXF90415.1 DsrE family protein [Neolewinella aurantiaca]
MTRLLQTLLLLTFVCTCGRAQGKINPVVPSFGGIYAIPEATVRPDSSIEYKIVVDVKTGSEAPDQYSAGLHNVARMLNLHEAGGGFNDQMTVVLAIHGGATYSVLSNDAYKEKFGVDNPNIDLIRELKVAGVQLTVCGQSLKGRKVDTQTVLPEVEIATSMLTTVATCQMKGFAVFQF